ncbi:hypothetical protein PI124_g20791 [Phytophthora idaei]|nr:hypothetical protein PI124_g20791 [Phytophthora idaei]
MVSCYDDQDEGSAGEDDTSDGVATDDDFYDLDGTPVADAINSDANTDEDVMSQYDEMYALSQGRDGIKDRKANGWNYDRWSVCI